MGLAFNPLLAYIDIPKAQQAIGYLIDGYVNQAIQTLQNGRSIKDAVQGERPSSFLIKVSVHSYFNSISKAKLAQHRNKIKAVFSNDEHAYIYLRSSFNRLLDTMAGVVKAANKQEVDLFPLNGDSVAIVKALIDEPHADDRKGTKLELLYYSLDMELYCVMTWLILANEVEVTEEKAFELHAALLDCADEIGAISSELDLDTEPVGIEFIGELDEATKKEQKAIAEEGMADYAKQLEQYYE